MMFREMTLRVAAAFAVAGALALAGCGGGGSKSMLPIAANGATVSPQSTTAYVETTVPNAVAAQSAQSTQRAILSSAKKPAFIDTTTANSSIVVSVTPSDPAEAAQFGNLTVCYNLYVGGTLAPQNAGAGFTYTNVGNTVTTVRLAIPAPPGTDGYQITQYAGLCGSTPFTVPTPPPGTLGSSNIISQTPVTYAYIIPGASNDLNNQIANCPAQTVPCPLGVGAGGVPLTASVAIASIAFGALPIPSPVREQGAFTLATGRIGVPIPLEALNAAGTVVPGLTTIATPTGGAGPFPSGVVVTSNDTTTHTKLYLVDATNGAIAQAATSNATGLTIHEFNALSGAVATGGNDITFGGSTAVAGDPWVIILAYDGAGGSATAALQSVTVTATATIPPATTPTAITTTITPQSAVYTAGGTGYVDAAAPAAGLSLLQSGGSVYITDGNKLRIDGSATVSPATGTTLGGIAAATWPNATNFIYAIDNATVGGTGSVAEIASGLYAFNPATLAATPVSAAAGANNYITFPGPVAVVQAVGTTGTGHPYLFVIDKNGGIYRVDISGASEIAPIGGFQEATNVLPTIATTGTAISPGSAKYLGTAPLASGLFLVADPGNNRIAQVDATQNPAVITAWSTCPSCTGLVLSGTAAYATSTTGQIYYIPGTGATPVSLGFATGTAVDGPIGTFASLAPAATPVLTPANYGLQFQPGSFFNQTTPYAAATGASYAALAAPYTVAPFPNTAPPKAFAAAPAAGVGLIADTSAGGTTGAGKINATGGIVVVAPTTASTATLTTDSILFIDSAGATGKLRTIVH